MYRTFALPRASSTALRAFRLQARPFSLTATQQINDQGIDSKHSVNKVKESNSSGQHEQSVKGGMESANKEGGGGNATAGHDSAGGKAKAKKDFPESPDPGMGMQDERGGKGG